MARRRSPRQEPPEDFDPEKMAERAREIVLTQLSAGPRTRAQLEDKLADKGVPEQVASAVLDRLAEVGLVDDAAFAVAWAASRHRSKGLSRSAVKMELRRKGVSDEDIEPAVEQIDEDSERAAALGLARRKAPSTRALDRDARVRRLVGMLGRKGYGPGLAFSVVKEVLAEEAVETDDLDVLGME